MAEACPACAAAIPDERLLIDARIEQAFDARVPLRSCPACLTVARGSAIILAGAAVARAKEHLASAAEEGRLAAELMRLSRAPETWPLARVPEVYPACGFRVGAPVRAIADNLIVLERRRLRVREEGEARTRKDWAVLQRIFAGKWIGAPGEPSAPSLSWEAAPDRLGAGAVMIVIALEPPALVLAPQEAWVLTLSMSTLATHVKTFRVYADAIAPFDIQ